MTFTTINLTQHETLPEQAELGVTSCHCPEFVKELLTFEEIPSEKDMIERAKKLAEITVDDLVTINLSPDYRFVNPKDGVEVLKERGIVPRAMIGGAPYFMPILELVLIEFGIIPCYSFSKRISSEKDEIKTSIFKFSGIFEKSPIIATKYN